MDRPDVLANISRDPAPGDGAGPRHPRRPPGLARASSTPAGPRATRSRRCPRAASRWSRVEEAAEPLVRLIRSFRPHVVTTYDENGGYPHPDHVMCHEVSVAAFEAAGDPERYPDAGEPWQPLKLYYHHSFHRAADRRRCTTRCSRAGWSRRTPSGSRSGSPTRSTTPGSPPGCRARSTSRSATRRCWRTPPRSTPTAPGSRSRWTCSRRSGRPRTSSSSRSHGRTRELPEDDLFAGIREQVGRVDA